MANRVGLFYDYGRMYDIFLPAASIPMSTSKLSSSSQNKNVDRKSIAIIANNSEVMVIDENRTPIALSIPSPPKKKRVSFSVDMSRIREEEE